MEVEIPRREFFTIDCYKPEDRDAVRQLCCEVAYGGLPLERWLDVDRRLFADLFTAYYTDCEPESAFVARMAGTVVGYVFTCLDTARYRRLWRTRVLLPSLRRIVTGHYSLRIRVLPRLLALGFAYVRGRGLRVPWREFPGHMHINTAPSVRGYSALTRSLLHRGFDHFVEHGVTRIHGVMMTSRARMESKYQRLGFRVWSHYRAPRPATHGSGESKWVVLTIDLARFPHHPLDTEHLRTQADALAPEDEDR